MLRKLIVGVAAILVLCGGVLKAHHSYAEYLPAGQSTTTLEGTIENIQFVNPHILFRIRTADATPYTLMWNGIQNVARYGVTSTTLKIGDHIIVTGSPAKDPAVRSLGRLSEIRRPSDGWVYRSGGLAGVSLTGAAAQGVAALAGTWTIDRAASTAPVVGDPGPERLVIAASSTEVKITRTYRETGVGPVVAVHRLDGSGTVVADGTVEKEPAASQEDGKLIITNRRPSRGGAPTVVKWMFSVAGDTLTVVRSVSTSSSGELKQTMVFTRN